MTAQNNFSKGRIIAGWVLVGLLGALFIFSASMKLQGSAEVAANFSKYGLGGKELLIGVGEILTIILFIIPRTSSLGVLVLSAFVGGAIVTHMEHGESYVFPSILLVVVWIANWLRNPEMLASFTKR